MNTGQNGGPNPNEKKLDVNDIYGPLIELVIHGQDNKLNLLSSFLFFQSILLLAWATVLQIQQATGRDTILLVFSVFGFLSSVLWAVLGADYDLASRQFGEVAEQFEKLYFETDIPQFLSARGEKVRTKALKGRHLIAFVAWGFAALYVVLEFVLCKSGH